MIVALEIVLPDSGVFEVGDTLVPRARALNGRGDSVGGGGISWATLDTALAAVLDPATGATLGKAAGTPRIQARVGNLRSDPVVLVVQPPLDSIRAEGEVRDTVTLSGTPKDSISDPLRVRVFALTPPSQTLLRRRLTYEFAAFPPTGSTVTLIPNDTVYTPAVPDSGIAVVQVRLDAGGPPDSVRVTARAAHHDGTPVPGSPLTFVVEFRP